MKYILFYRIEPPIYFIAAIRTTATFSCKTCRWRDFQLTITLWPVVTPRPWTLHANTYWSIHV